MGLDWVVIAKTVDGMEVHPTEIVGARRASKADPEVVEILRRIHQDRKERTPFDQWLTSLTEKDPPPIVISYGEEARDAVPGVQAEVQYYGFRGKALEPDLNRVSAHAAGGGERFDWLWSDLRSSEEVQESIQRLERLLANYGRDHPQSLDLGKRRFEAWRGQDPSGVRAIDEESSGNSDLQDEIFGVFSYLSAIQWLSFWKDKGFRIAADY